MKLYCSLTVFLFLLATTSCGVRIELAIPDNIQEYKDEMQRWRNDRIRSLTAPEGWLSLVGLYWLSEGSHTLGASKNMDIVLESPAPGMLGRFTVKGDKVHFEAGGEAYVTSNGERFVEGPVFYDQSGNLTKLEFRSLVFYIIERQGRIGLRIKDTLSDNRFSLDSIPHYPLDTDYRVYARIKATEKSRQVTVEDITGGSQEYTVEAMLEFGLSGKAFSLAAFDGGKDHYFVIFKDNTNGDRSYGGGRYLYVSREPADNGLVILDFNQAINPPCAFTDYATCPIPPQENELDIEIKAGEKYPIVYKER